MSEIIIENNKQIFPFDPYKKIESIREILDEKLFGDDAPTITEQRFNRQGDVNTIVFKSYQKNPMLISTVIHEIFRDYNIFSYLEIENAFDKEFIIDCLKAFTELISYINTYIKFLPTKQLACSFMQITEITWNRLLSKPKDIAVNTAMESFENYIVDITFTASQNDMVKEKSTITRLKTKNVGHGLSETQSEDNGNSPIFILTNEQVRNKLEKFKNAQINYKNQ